MLIFNLLLIKRFYIWEYRLNFGDNYNRELINFFKIPFNVTKPQDAEVICVGSILDCFFNKREKSKHPLTVLGAGFPQSINIVSTIHPFITVQALRGKLSYEVLFKQNLKNIHFNDLIFGDPGICANKVFQIEKKENQHLNVCVVPHFTDKQSPYLRNIKIPFHVIDPQQKAKYVIQEMINCKFIFSSSLHGLIFADSLSIPNQRILLSKVRSNPFRSGYNFKYDDYFSIYNLTSNPYDLLKFTITNKNFNEFLIYQESNIRLKKTVINSFCSKFFKKMRKLKVNENTKLILILKLDTISTIKNNFFLKISLTQIFCFFILFLMIIFNQHEALLLNSQLSS